LTLTKTAKCNDVT